MEVPTAASMQVLCAKTRLARIITYPVAIKTALEPFNTAFHAGCEIKQTRPSVPRLMSGRDRGCRTAVLTALPQPALLPGEYNEQQTKN